MRSAQNGHVEVVRALLAGGADVNFKNNGNRTAVDYASGKPEIIALLQAHKSSKAAKAASAQSAPSKAAAQKNVKAIKAPSSANGGVARAVGGAANKSAANKTLCAAVAAKIFNNAGVQTDRLVCDALTQTDEPVQGQSSMAQKRFATSTGSAFKRPETTVVPTGEASATSAAQPSLEIMRPIARRPQEFGWPSMQPVMAQPVAAQIQLLPNLIAQAVRNVTGLFGLIELLNSSSRDDYFDAHQAAALFRFMSFDASVFAQVNYAPITGSQLAEILLNNIKAILGDIDPSGNFTHIQTSMIHTLNHRFALYAQSLGI
jgi:hypothetical protein